MLKCRYVTNKFFEIIEKFFFLFSSFIQQFFCITEKKKLHMKIKERKIQTEKNIRGRITIELFRTFFFLFNTVEKILFCSSVVTRSQKLFG